MSIEGTHRGRPRCSEAAPVCCFVGARPASPGWPQAITGRGTDFRRVPRRCRVRSLPAGEAGLAPTGRVVPYGVVPDPGAVPEDAFAGAGVSGRSVTCT